MAVAGAHEVPVFALIQAIDVQVSTQSYFSEQLNLAKSYG